MWCAKKDDKFDARGVRPIVIPRPTRWLSVNAITSVTTYWYRITRIKRGREGGKGRSWKRARGREEEVATRERLALTSNPEYRQVTLAKQPPSSFLTLPFSLRLGLSISLDSIFHPSSSLFLSHSALLSCCAVRTRSSSVIDRNLSLTSLPPGAKILPGALRPRPAASPSPPPSSWSSSSWSSSFLVLVSSLLLVSPRFLRHLPACSMIIEPAGSPLLAPAALVQQRKQYDLYLQNRSTK